MPNNHEHEMFVTHVFFASNGQAFLRVVCMPDDGDCDYEEIIPGKDT